MKTHAAALALALFVGAVLACPPPLKSCGQACYLENLYCCPNGALVQKQFCPNNGGGDGGGGGGNGDRDGQYGRIEKGDRWGGDIGSETASNAEDCQAKCFRNNDCKVWAFDTCGNSCWLKNGGANGVDRNAKCRVCGTITANRNGGGGGGGNNPSCAYGNEQKMTGWGFFDQFNFFTGPDPTHGFVQYVDRGTAQNQGLISVNGNGQIYIGVDKDNRAPQGRRSVRLESKNRIQNNMLILDLAHMPGSICGTWPAFWTFGPNWPNSGEIDIIEGVNRESRNSITLHTKPGCTMPGGRDMGGSAKSSNCDANVNGNEGCGVLLNKPNSYGDGFNNQGGGVYVMERIDSLINAWYFPRNGIPGDVLSGRPNPCNWGKPDAHFPLGGNCPSGHFGPQNIIFNIAFCGDWAGAVYGQQGCGGNCVDFVANNPQAFRESYWLINSLRILSR